MYGLATRNDSRLAGRLVHFTELCRTTVLLPPPPGYLPRTEDDEVLQRTGLTSLYHLLSRRRISVFGHVARLDDDTPANMSLQLHINVSLNRPPDRTWRRPPGRPRKKWVDQLRNDSTRSFRIASLFMSYRLL